MSVPVMFYHVVETNKVAVLFELLKKSFESRKRCLVHIDTLENAQQISDQLWRAQDDYILPHGIINEAMPDKQPILLTDKLENVNQADYIFFIGKSDIVEFESYKRCVVIFDDYSDDIKIHFRSEYKRLREQGSPLTYYQQVQGKWVAKG